GRTRARRPAGQPRRSRRSLRASYGANAITLPLSGLKEETFKVDVFLSECQYLHAGPKFTARIKQWRQALALPEDASAFLLEILKFLATVALIMVSAVIMLMAG
ncbi:MAG: hypothetical protein Q8M54_08355, partial [Desulfobaccales bacterium]|nr:hypothetical protein [Desulfobaccales bacterium]